MYVFSNQKQQTPKARAGFSLVETLVAVAALLAGLTGVLALTTTSLVTTGVARDQIIAFHLAQEPVEYIRAVRDANTLEGLFNDDSDPDPNWLVGLPSCTEGDPCTVDATDENVGTAILSCPVGGCAPLEYNDALGFYGYGPPSDWEPTRFTRETYFEEIGADKEVEVVTSVTWTRGARTRTFSITTYLLKTD